MNHEKSSCCLKYLIAFGSFGVVLVDHLVLVYNYGYRGKEMSEYVLFCGSNRSQSSCHSDLDFKLQHTTHHCLMIKISITLEIDKTMRTKNSLN